MRPDDRREGNVCGMNLKLLILYHSNYSQILDDLIFVYPFNVHLM